MVMKKVFLGLVLMVLGLGGTLLWSQEWQQVATLATDVQGGGDSVERGVDRCRNRGRPAVD